ncbi:MAG TPA: hypothetical protein VMV72_08140 [Verrucomicrobiae bacterium]|nr:hypothetical protein [Verrucomicrobiae bacterium]
MTTKLAVVLLATAVLADGGLVSAQETVTPKTLVWCGLDYSRVKMIGTKDFRNPAGIFPGMPEAWNTMFVNEALPRLKKDVPEVLTSTETVQPGNAKLTADCIIRQDGSEAEMVQPTHITQQDIAATVKAYDIKYKQGLGLVFIMDRLVKSEKTGCMYVVFFDIATRKVVLSERRCESAFGGGFRNYWFAPAKRAAKDLPEMYEKAKAAK